MKFISFLLSLMLVVSNVGAYNPPAPPSDGTYIVDQTGRLNRSEIHELNNKIQTLKNDTGNQLGILLLPSMGGDNIEDVAYATFNSWGIGSKELDNGVLIVISLKERKSRIETGKGIGGELPDITTQDILRENLNPYLKRGNFYEGLNQTVAAIYSKLDTRPQVASESIHISLPALVASAFSLIICFLGFLFLRASRIRKSFHHKMNDVLLEKTPTPTFRSPPATKISKTITKQKPISMLTATLPSIQHSLIESERIHVSTKTAQAPKPPPPRKKQKTKRPDSYDTLPSSNSFDFGSGSSGGGFDGGSSGGGGSSSDW